MFALISVLSVDVLLFLGFIFIIFKMMGKSYIDISKCRKRYFDRLDGSDAEYHESDFISDSENNNESDTTQSDRSYYEDVIFTLYIGLQQYFNIEENRTKLLNILSSNSNILILGLVKFEKLSSLKLKNTSPCLLKIYIFEIVRKLINSPNPFFITLI